MIYYILLYSQIIAKPKKKLIHTKKRDWKITWSVVKKYKNIYIRVITYISIYLSIKHDIMQLSKKKLFAPKKCPVNSRVI